MTYLANGNALVQAGLIAFSICVECLAVPYLLKAVTAAQQFP